MGKILEPAHHRAYLGPALATVLSSVYKIITVRPNLEYWSKTKFCFSSSPTHVGKPDWTKKLASRVLASAAHIRSGTDRPADRQVKRGTNVRIVKTKQIRHEPFKDSPFQPNNLSIGLRIPTRTQCIKSKGLSQHRERLPVFLFKFHQNGVNQSNQIFLHIWT